eukprot:TRINITY_DN13040_c0_g1_i1.p1 TRINITY_DN13040_c0_g1~~TRINITY_DN13040_c0_g1_i1.p1  ORF type:complete len:133 (+),score=14.12 TRINITY_DN13040_c0_g1_i1:75-473(+)
MYTLPPSAFPNAQSHLKGVQWEGTWKDNQLTGYGLRIHYYSVPDHPRGEIQLAIECANWEGEDAYGFGKQILDNRLVYEGYWKKSQYEGAGVLRCENGAHFKGRFKDGKKDGKGVLFFETGHKYEGILSSFL